MTEDKVDKIVRIVRQVYWVYPRLSIIDLAPRDCQLIWDVHVALYVVDCWNRSPAHQLANALHLRLGFEHQQDLLADDDVDIYAHVLLHLVARLSRRLILLLLHARINCYATFLGTRIILHLCLHARCWWRLILHPDLLIVILKAQIEVADHADVHVLADAAVSLQNLLNKCGNLLKEIVQVHGRTPFIIISGFDVVIILVKLRAGLVYRCIDLPVIPEFADGFSFLCDYVV